ncbi:MAG: general secretion pathway protein GspK [Ottowia sp.]|nr:general secretion pathway protein GspK [Ottowia sp.]
MDGRSFTSSRGRGMALVAVLWIVAALSVMATGLTATVKDQIQAVSAERQGVEAEAIGDAAIDLVLQQLLVGNTTVSSITISNVSYAGQEVRVEVAPLNGLISLNDAPEPLMAALLQVAGGLSQGEAQALAHAAVEWRDGIPAAAGGAGSQPRMFETAQDLLLVPGFTYLLYERLAPLVSADLRGASRVNPLAAPPGVLRVLAGGNAGRVDQFLSQRGGGSAAPDFSGLAPAFMDLSGSNMLRLRAFVGSGADKTTILTRDVALDQGHAYGVPWRDLRRWRQTAEAEG